MEDLYNAFKSDGLLVKMRKLYKYKNRIHVGWDWGNQIECRFVAPFNPLKRFEDADFETLKIAPAYIKVGVEFTARYEHRGGGLRDRTCTFSLHIPSVSGPSSYGSDSTGTARTMQAILEDTAEEVDESSKPDVMNVVFMDGNVETAVSYDVETSEYIRAGVRLAFTDYYFKNPDLDNSWNRRKWSFCLNEVEGYEFYLGQMHKLDFRCSHKVKHIFTFLADDIPSPTDIFIIKGKRFACEKIEGSIRNGQIDRLMTGYFYEILS